MDHYQDSGVGQSRVGLPASLEVRPSERSANIRYAIRDILNLAQEAQAAGKELLPLNIGDPLLFDFRTPRHIIEATYQAMLAGRNGYAPSAGVEEAIEAVRREASSLGMRNIQDVFITSGVSEGIEIAFAALLNTGENILIPSPGYPLFEATLAKLGFEAIPYYLDETNGWQPDLSQMARLINGRTRAIVVINPNNPTGAVCHRERLRGILDLAARHGLLTFSDETYSKLLLDPLEHVPLASLISEQPVVTFNGLTKAYLVPGFRVGWGILSGDERNVADYREAIAKMLRVRLCANHPAQFAIRPALEGNQGHIPEMVAKLRRRRELIVSLLNSVPNIRCSSPQAAFYAFPRLEISRSDQEFVADLIRQTGVLVVPGTGFGQQPGSKHFRLVFLPAEETLEKALNLIGAFARKWH
ncbi:MAG: aminotransferase class I/II-fold pyridoxal phosphate-dependent enzyme [Acidobacteria bacterium]|nr:aminotransferase class I/II-fold pyridoxal phosphate-dependent enzyme [Acidobacteriota bacterium]